MTGRMDWTDDAKAELARRWDAGDSARSIGGHFGVSRNAIIGQAHRLRLRARRPPKRIDERRARIDIDVARAGVPAAAPPASKCQYPFGDVGDADFHYCGETVTLGSSYCMEHHVLCHRSAGFDDNDHKLGTHRR